MAGTTGGQFLESNEQQTTAHIKGKLQSLEEHLFQLTEELNMHKKEIQILRSEKETLDSVLKMKTQESRKVLTNELFRVEEELKRHYQHQTAENQRMMQIIQNIKNEKTSIEQNMIGMQKRINELELQIGEE